MCSNVFWLGRLEAVFVNEWGYELVCLGTVEEAALKLAKLFVVSTQVDPHPKFPG